MFILPSVWSQISEFALHNSRIKSTQVVENNEELLINIELPGAQQKDLKVELNGDVLSIELTPSSEAHEVEGSLIWQEFAIHPVQLRYRLSSTLNHEHIHATLHDGLLTILIEKSKNSSRVIPVQMTQNQVA